MSTGYGLFYNFAALVAPNVGAAFYGAYKPYGYQTTCDISMIANLVVGVIFLVFNCGPNVYKNYEAEKAVIAELKEVEAKLEVLAEIEVHEGAQGVPKFVSSSINQIDEQAEGEEGSIAFEQ